MFARINFFLAVAAIAIAVFYLIGRYLIVAPIAFLLPATQPYVAGAVILIALMLVVRVLSDAMSILEAQSLAARDRDMGTIGQAAQILIVTAHFLVVIGAWSIFSPGHFARTLPTLATAVFLYACGVLAAVKDFRDRAA